MTIKEMQAAELLKNQELSKPEIKKLAKICTSSGYLDFWRDIEKHPQSMDIRSAILNMAENKKNVQAFLDVTDRIIYTTSRIAIIAIGVGFTYLNYRFFVEE